MCACFFFLSVFSTSVREFMGSKHGRTFGTTSCSVCPPPRPSPARWSAPFGRCRRPHSRIPPYLRRDSGEYSQELLVQTAGGQTRLGEWVVKAVMRARSCSTARDLISRWGRGRGEAASGHRPSASEVLALLQAFRFRNAIWKKLPENAPPALSDKLIWRL